jgi:hypothetical protein
MKPTKAPSKPVHPADARRISFRGLSAETVIAAALQVKPEPKPAKRRKRKK